VQTEWVAALVSREVPLPSPEEMRAGMLDDERFVEKTYPSAPRYGLELDPVRYRQQITEELKHAPEKDADRLLADLPKVDTGPWG